MRVLVTGAASPLGRVLTSQLIQRGDAVVGQVRRRSAISSLRNLGAETVLADLSDARQLAAAMDGCERVFHLAHYFDFWAPTLTTFHDVNVFGTENVMTAVAMAGVPRVVYCSTSLTVGEREGRYGTVKQGRSPAGRTAFERSAIAAETLALRFRAKGIDVVIVNPALIVAPNDPGWTGRLLASQVAGRPRCASTAEMGWISAYDAARGLVRAGDRGKSGTRYVLCADRLSPHQLLTHVARLSGQRAPQPLSAAAALAQAYLSITIASATRRRPSMPMDEQRFITAGFQADGIEASLSLELDYTPLNRYLPHVVASYRKKMRHFHIGS